LENLRKGRVIWLTGLPCSGKTTLAKSLEHFFKKIGKPVQVLDGDTFRKTVSKDLGFSKKDRDENIRRAAWIARLIADNNINVIVSFISPYKKARRLARKICPNFVEIYLKCDIKECMRRDSKNKYARAIKGEVESFTGIQDPYEEPENAELIIETDKFPLEKNVNKILDFVKIWKH